MYDADQLHELAVQMTDDFVQFVGDEGMTVDEAITFAMKGELSFPLSSQVSSFDEAYDLYTDVVQKWVVKLLWSYVSAYNEHLDSVVVLNNLRALANDMQNAEELDGLLAIYQLHHEQEKTNRLPGSSHPVVSSQYNVRVEPLSQVSPRRSSQAQGTRTVWGRPWNHGLTYQFPRIPPPDEE